MSDFGYVRQLNVNHTGMVYKFIKKGDVFIHTMIEGELLYNLGFTQMDIIGKTLHQFYPEDYANIKHQYYVEAWEGKFVQYESEINGIYQVASLRPVIKNGEIVEVVGSCINVTEQIILQKVVSQKDNVHQTVQKTISDAILYNALQMASLVSNQTERQSSTAVKKDLMIKEHNNIIFVPLNEIIFIERMDRKSVIHTNNKQFETYETLASLSQHLDERFIGCHRSYIINIDYLEVIEQSGQRYIGHFKNYKKTAKISKNKIIELKKYKSY